MLLIHHRQVPGNTDKQAGRHQGCPPFSPIQHRYEVALDERIPGKITL